jgi:hypothetical protein
VAPPELLLALHLRLQAPEPEALLEPEISPFLAMAAIKES